ncbi:peptidyl-prolyl cis-trans isomerase [Sulfurimonas sp.]|uniref:peptidylprolyl isomerase n=1 Tax=Sulfurimonas sp. TaxID=2022749 RepID=UPI002AAF7CF3|nr:peptidyl-prolyl cis-trans isomerase [Sulfurimonas sp.]
MKMTKITKIFTALLFASTLVSANTIVTVNGTKITQKDVYEGLMNATKGGFNQVPAEKQAKLGQQFLQELIAKELIYGDAKKTGVMKSKKFKDEYKKVQENIKKQLAIKIWQENLHDSIKVSNKELKSYYDKNKEEFYEKESVHARHVLVKTKSEAEAVIKELKSFKGAELKAKFIEVAKSKSIGPSGPRGGDLNYFARGRMFPAFNDAAFSMRVGTMSKEPVQTQAGFHVIYIEDKKAKKILAFTEVKSFIEKRLKAEKFKSVMQSKMQKLEKKATIK